MLNWGFLEEDYTEMVYSGRNIPAENMRMCLACACWRISLKLRTKAGP